MYMLTYLYPYTSLASLSSFSPSPSHQTLRTHEHVPAASIIWRTPLIHKQVEWTPILLPCDLTSRHSFTSRVRMPFAFPATFGRLFSKV